MKLWHGAFFVLALVVFGLALAPASIFLPPRPGAFTYERMSGPVWRGRAEGVNLSGYGVDTVAWAVAPQSLLAGAVQVDATAAGGDLGGDLSVTVGPSGAQRLRSRAFTLRGLPLPSRGVILPGVTSVRGLDIAFAGGVCASASGDLRSEVLATGASGLGLSGPALTGKAMCGGEEAWLIFEGAEQGQRYRAVLALRADGEARWQVSAIAATQEARALLAAAGFAPVEGEAALELTRTFRWLPF